MSSDMHLTYTCQYGSLYVYEAAPYVYGKAKQVPIVIGVFTISKARALFLLVL